MKYITTIGDREFTIVIDRDDEITVDGVHYEVDFRQLQEASVISMLLNSRSFEANVEQRNDKWEVLIHGDLFSVEVQDERSYRLRQARGEKELVSGEVTMKAPMPGIIVAVLVKSGDIVESGQTVVILESMKMENELRSPLNGTVRDVHVAPGDSVEKLQLLVSISS